VSAHLMVHMYRGGPTTWRGREGVLDERQKRLLAPRRHDVAVTRDDNDVALFAALQRDGRASFADLAKATGAAPATVARRLADLQAGGVLFFDVDVDDALYGVRTMALLWMSVAPAHLDDVATALAGHDELAVVAATTGPTNLMAQALCAGPGELHRYLTHRLGALEAIRTIETAPILRTVKATSPITR
jgi:DNA-binding Lrp family transcriptional regulator